MNMINLRFRPVVKMPDIWSVTNRLLQTARKTTGQNGVAVRRLLIIHYDW